MSASKPTTGEPIKTKGIARTADANNVSVLSKCVAGGFSAGVVLLWWPLLVPGDSLTAWLSRGVAFTLAFELLLLGLRPLEHALWATRRGTRLRTRLDAIAERLSSGDTVRRLGSTATLAAVAVAVPAVLITAGLHERPRDDGQQRARAPRVVRITKVVRPVKVERIVESAPVTTTPAATPTRSPVAPSRPTRPKRTSKPRPAEQPAKARTEAQAIEERSVPKAQADEPEGAGDDTERPASGSSVDTRPQLG